MNTTDPRVCLDNLQDTTIAPVFAICVSIVFSKMAAVLELESERLNRHVFIANARLHLTHQSHAPVSRTSLTHQSHAPVSRTSLKPQSHAPVSNPSLTHQCQAPVASPSLNSQSQASVFSVSLQFQSHASVSSLSFTSKFVEGAELDNLYCKFC